MHVVSTTNPGAVVLSTARANCQDFFTCSQEYRCCKQNQPWIATLRAHPLPMFPFNVFGVGPIDIQVETTWLYNHFPVDLGLQVVASNTTSIQVSANCYSAVLNSPQQLVLLSNHLAEIEGATVGATYTYRGCSRGPVHCDCQQQFQLQRSMLQTPIPEQTNLLADQ